MNTFQMFSFPENCPLYRSGVYQQDMIMLHGAGTSGSWHLTGQVERKRAVGPTLCPGDRDRVMLQGVWKVATGATILSGDASGGVQSKNRSYQVSDTADSVTSNIRTQVTK